MFDSLGSIASACFLADVSIDVDDLKSRESNQSEPANSVTNDD